MAIEPHPGYGGAMFEATWRKPTAVPMDCCVRNRVEVNPLNLEPVQILIFFLLVCVKHDRQVQLCLATLDFDLQVGLSMRDQKRHGNGERVNHGCLLGLIVDLDPN